MRSLFDNICHFNPLFESGNAQYTEKEQAYPDSIECSQHEWYSFSYFCWKELFRSESIMIINESDTDVVRIAKPVSKYTKEETTETEAADNKTTDQSLSARQVTPPSSEG